jgi:hypothetical protein
MHYPGIKVLGRQRIPRADGHTNWVSTPQISASERNREMPVYAARRVAY